MPASKTEQIIVLALEVLEDAEMSRSSVESLVLKASRLARLVGDEEATLWLWYERMGYVDDEETSLKYMTLTHRWINAESKIGYWRSVGYQEGILELAQEELKAAKQPIPSGEWAGYTFTHQQQTITEIIKKMQAARNVVASVRAQIQEFATRIYHERLFSAQSETIFEQYQKDVDVLLANTAERAFVRLPQALRRARDGSRRFSAADWALPDRAPNVKALTFSQFKLKIIGNLILNGTLVISIDPKNATILRYLTIDRKRASCDEGG